MAAKRHKLEIVGSDEQSPRQIRAFGKACGGEFALVLNPVAREGVLVHVAGKGKKVKGFLWEATIDSDVPVRPITEVDVAKGVARLKAVKKGLPKSSGAASLRGKWTGYVECDETAPHVVLTRRVASYVTVEVESHADGWRAKAVRHGTWFGEAATQTQPSGPAPTLDVAILEAVRMAREIVASACTTRDTTRRAVVDRAYGEKHPNRRAADPKRDATERLNAPGLGRARRAPGETAKKPAIVPPAPAPTVAAPPRRGPPQVEVVVVNDRTSKGKGKTQPAEIDAEKDRLLLEHLTKAIQSAVEAE